MKRQSLLAIYLCVAALFQFGVYVAAVQWHNVSITLYFDPRMGIDAWLTTGSMSDQVRADAESVSEIIRYASAVWLLGVGLILGFQKRGLRLYVISECLLALPTVAFFALVIAANMSPAHGFSITELMIPLVAQSYLSP